MTELLTDKASASVPDVRGRFGQFGGRFVPETLTQALDHWPTNTKRRSVILSFSVNWIICSRRLLVAPVRCITLNVLAKPSAALRFGSNAKT